jgi:hypothetical protein
MVDGPVAISTFGGQIGHLTASFANLSKSTANGVMARVKYVVDNIFQVLMKKSVLWIMGILTTIVGGLVAVGSVFKSVGCVLKYIFVDHFIDCFAELGQVLYFFFINPFMPPTVCILWWVIFVVLFIIWHLFYSILKSMNMEFIMDMMFCTFRIFDDLELTGGSLYLTKFPKMVLCNCFSIPSMNSWANYYLSKCNSNGDGNFGIKMSFKDTINKESPPAQLNQCYGPCGDTSSNCEYPVDCPFFMTSN